MVKCLPCECETLSLTCKNRVKRKRKKTAWWQTLIIHVCAGELEVGWLRGPASIRVGPGQQETLYPQSEGQQCLRDDCWRCLWPLHTREDTRTRTHTCTGLSFVLKSLNYFYMGTLCVFPFLSGPQKKHVVLKKNKTKTVCLRKANHNFL